MLTSKGNSSDFVPGLDPGTPPPPLPQELGKVRGTFISLELYVNCKLRCDRTVAEPGVSFRTTAFECRAGAESHPNESMIS